MNGPLRIDEKRKLLIARRGWRTAEVRLVDGLVGHLADSLRSGKTGLRWGEVRVLPPAAAGITEVTVGGKDGVTVLLDRAEALVMADRLDPPPENPDEPYVRLRETNNWEMERWRFYIPLRGNEKAVRILTTAIGAMRPKEGCFLGEHLPYDIRTIPMTEAEVDRLCRRGRCRGYMASHNKLEGRLDLRMAKAAAERMSGEDDRLYKGRVTKMMKPWGRRPAAVAWPTGRHMAAANRMKLRDLYGVTAGGLLSNDGPVSVVGFRLGPPRRRVSFKERCLDAVLRLEAAGFRTAGNVAKLTRGQLLAVPDIGRKTVDLARWMLRDIGLDFAQTS